MYFIVICKPQAINLISTALVLKKKQVCCNERMHDLLIDL